MNLLDRLVLLVTGLVAIYLLWRFYTDYRRSPAQHTLSYIIGFAVLLVAGLLLIALTYSVLASPLVVIVAALIPLGIATGLVGEFLPNYGKGYLIFAVVGFLTLAVTRLAAMGPIATVTLILVHTVAGLTIVLAPILATRQGKAPSGFLGVTVGGALIGVGGIALAFLKTGSQLLFFSAEVVFAILAPLLLLMTLALTWGFVKKIRAA